MGTFFSAAFAILFFIACLLTLVGFALYGIGVLVMGKPGDSTGDSEVDSILKEVRRDLWEEEVKRKQKKEPEN